MTEPKDSVPIEPKIYWVIEDLRQPQPTYLADRDKETWTADIRKAERYEQQSHAEDDIATLGATEDYPSKFIVSREHIDVPPPPVSLAAEGSEVVKCKYCNRVGCESEKHRDDARLLRMCRHAVQLERDFLANHVGRVKASITEAQTQLTEARKDAETGWTEVARLGVELARAEAERDGWHRKAFTLAHHIQSPVIEVTRKEALELANTVVREPHPDAPHPNIGSGGGDERGSTAWAPGVGDVVRKKYAVAPPETGLCCVTGLLEMDGVPCARFTYQHLGFSPTITGIDALVSLEPADPTPAPSEVERFKPNLGYAPKQPVSPFATRAELVAALRKAGNDDELSWDEALNRAADELERTGAKL